MSTKITSRVLNAGSLGRLPNFKEGGTFVILAVSSESRDW